jgi:FMN phosphatase YigB (HAD superfamily)
MKFIITKSGFDLKWLLRRYRFFLLDLDNTLYAEEDYLFPAYKSIARHLAEKQNQSADAMQGFMTNTFKTRGRRLLFDALCDKFNIPTELISDMLFILRTNKPERKIFLYPEMQRLLSALHENNKQVFVVTNGSPRQQKNKVQCIDWNGMGENVKFVYASEQQPKPHRACFDSLKYSWRLTESDSVMIGDSQTDEAFAMNCGIDYGERKK